MHRGAYAYRHTYRHAYLCTHPPTRLQTDKLTSVHAQKDASARKHLHTPAYERTRSCMRRHPPTRPASRRPPFRATAPATPTPRAAEQGRRGAPRRPQTPPAGRRAGFQLAATISRQTRRPPEGMGRQSPAVSRGGRGWGGHGRVAGRMWSSAAWVPAPSPTGSNSWEPVTSRGTCRKRPWGNTRTHARETYVACACACPLGRSVEQWPAYRPVVKNAHELPLQLARDRPQGSLERGGRARDPAG